MTSGLGNFETFDQVQYNILQRIKDGSQVIHLQNNLNKIVGPQVIYYWYGTNIDVILAIELEVKHQGLMVNLIGKNPKYKGKSPFASELYDAILDDHHRSIRILSDEQLSDEGYDIWKKLFSLGRRISVYNRDTPGESFKPLTSLEDMNQYFKYNDYNFKKYQFVLSEAGEQFAETHSHFNTRRMRELCGLDLED
jgi:hypothetical protein